MSYLYFAYGSNLDPRQMTRRCPKAKFIGRASMRGWSLEFVGKSRNWGGAVANIERIAGAVVPGTVWRLNKKDLAAMDVCEGHPWVYKRITQPCRIEGRRGATPVQVYVHQFPFCMAYPSADYVERIAYGYARFALDEKALWDAIKKCEPSPELAYDMGLSVAYDTAAKSKPKGKGKKKGKKGRKCVACSGSGLSTRGGLCNPCDGTGRKDGRKSKIATTTSGRLFDLRPIPKTKRKR
jgi:hypothetical protein